MSRPILVTGVTLVMLAVWPVATTAQTSITIGPRAGLNFAMMTGDYLDTIATGASFGKDVLVRGAAGLFGQFGWSPRWAIRAEVLYSQQGGQWSASQTVGDIKTEVTQTLEIEYVAIPVLLRYAIPGNRSVVPNLYAGPAVAIRTASSAKFKAVADSVGKTLAHMDDWFDEIVNARSTIFEVVLGAGVDIKVGRNWLSLEARYTRSLGGVFDDVADPASVPADKAAVIEPDGTAIKLDHSFFSVLIGYGFSL